MQTLNEIGELTKILSVKSETCDSIMHFMACFRIGRILSKHSLDKMRGRDMAEQILAMMVFRILGEAVVCRKYKCMYFEQRVMKC